MEKIARIYVKGLFTVGLFFLLISILVHVCFAMGFKKLDEEFGPFLISAAVLICFGAFAMAKDKNILYNEFESCPWWVKGLTFAFAGYGIYMTFSHIMHSAESGGSEDRFRSSAMPLLFESVSLCVLYAALWTNTVRDEVLIRRSKISIATLIIGSIIVIARWNTFFPHSAR